MNWKKGSKRLAWVLSIVIGFAWFIFLALTVPASSFQDIVLMFLLGGGLFGFCGTWLVYFFIRWIAIPAIRWIAKGFKADVPDRKDEPESKE